MEERTQQLQYIPITEEQKKYTSVHTGGITEWKKACNFCSNSRWNHQVAEWEIFSEEIFSFNTVLACLFESTTLSSKIELVHLYSWKIKDLIC